MKRHSAWAVAAAVLLERKNAMHYTEIADQVIQSGISGLSDEGGRTPQQTMGAQIRNHSDIFQPDCEAGAGYYYIPDDDEAKANPKVRDALQALKGSR